MPPVGFEYGELAVFPEERPCAPCSVTSCPESPANARRCGCRLDGCGARLVQHRDGWIADRISSALRLRLQLEHLPRERRGDRSPRCTYQAVAIASKLGFRRSSTGSCLANLSSPTDGSSRRPRTTPCMSWPQTADRSCGHSTSHARAFFRLTLRRHLTPGRHHKHSGHRPGSPRNLRRR